MNECTCTTEEFSHGPVLIRCDTCALDEFQTALSGFADSAGQARDTVQRAVASLAGLS